MSESARTIIASFDIGIKNMAYCVLELDAAAAAQPVATCILAWGIINMVPEAEKPPICCAAQKKLPKKGCAAPPQPCTNISAFMCAGRNYCKKHIDKKRVIGAKDFSSLKKKTIDALREFCTKNAIPAAAVDFSDKKAKIVENIEKYLTANFYIPITATAAKSAKEMDLICAGREMTRQLDAIFTEQLLGQITHVFIENQISTLAVRMKTLQGMLTQYFIMRGAPDIRYISALKKLSGGGVASKTTKTKSTYSERKKQGIELCGKLLRESKSAEIAGWVDFFENSRTKRDDLSDAFLQGVYGWEARPKV